MDKNSEEHVQQRSSNISKRPRRSTSAVWDSFEKLPITIDGRQKARRRNCEQEYAADSRSGTTNLLWHIRNCPKQGLQDSHCSTVFDQDTYCGKVATTIIWHNYRFMFVEHEGIRDIHCF
ncbi:unnamed protein product [Camellia sinensis]